MLCPKQRVVSCSTPTKAWSTRSTGTPRSSSGGVSPSRCSRKTPAPLLAHACGAHACSRPWPPRFRRTAATACSLWRSRRTASSCSRAEITRVSSSGAQSRARYSPPFRLDARARGRACDAFVGMAVRLSVLLTQRRRPLAAGAHTGGPRALGALLAGGARQSLPLLSKSRRHRAAMAGRHRRGSYVWQARPLFARVLRAGRLGSWAMTPSSMQAVRSMVGHGTTVMSLALSPDGRTLFSGSRDHTVKLWALDSSEVTICCCLPRPWGSACLVHTRTHTSCSCS
jgi:hypothetical protein